MAVIQEIPAASKASMTNSVQPAMTATWSAWPPVNDEFLKYELRTQPKRARILDIQWLSLGE